MNNSRQSILSQPLEPPTPPPLPPALLLSSSKAEGRQLNHTNASINPAMDFSHHSSTPKTAQQVAQDKNLTQPIMSSKLFKDELIAKHSQMASTNCPSSIEDRIRNEKELFSSRQEIIDSRSPKQVDDVLGKLLSNVQEERRPFAYSPEVNDPNNRGRLDLNQIKSPTMRQRLLTNLNSLEDVEDDKVKELNEGTIDYEGSTPHREKQEYCIKYFQPEFENSYKADGEARINSTPQSIRYYNTPPLIHNIGDNSVPISPTDSLKYTDRLGIELAKSLDSLSLLVSNLETSPERIGQHNQRHTFEQKSGERDKPIDDEWKQQLQQKTSTFGPHGLTRRFDDQNEKRTRGSSYSPIDTASTYERSIGDYLLSPDSNYFTACSSRTSPYSILPYYGTSLDCERSSNFSPMNSSSDQSYEHYNPVKSDYNRNDEANRAYNDFLNRPSTQSRPPTNFDRFNRKNNTFK